MKYWSEAEMERLATGMMACTLPKEEWTHAAHFGATLWLMARRPELDLSRELPGMIRAYNVSVGGKNTDTGGYHETITQASLRAARAYLEARRGFELEYVWSALMLSPLGKSDWPLQYWSRERLFSVEARREWVEPDLRPLEF